MPVDCRLEIREQVSIEGAHLRAVADKRVVVARAPVDAAPRAQLPILEAATPTKKNRKILIFSEQKTDLVLYRYARRRAPIPRYQERKREYL